MTIKKHDIMKGLKVGAIVVVMYGGIAAIGYGIGSLAGTLIGKVMEE